MTLAARPHHILTVTVENKPGVLSRVAGLFSRRAFNIVSLAVSPTDDERFSRMTIVVDADSAPLEQVVKQLNKLIPVIKITEVPPAQGVERELMLVIVKAAAATTANPFNLKNLVMVSPFVSESIRAPHPEPDRARPAAHRASALRLPARR